MTIIFYSKTGCPWGDEVRNLLTSKDIPFEEREMHSHPEYMKECIDKSGQSKCPTLDIDGHMLADTDAAAVEEYLSKISKS